MINTFNNNSMICAAGNWPVADRGFCPGDSGRGRGGPDVCVIQLADPEAGVMRRRALLSRPHGRLTSLLRCCQLIAGGPLIVKGATWAQDVQIGTVSFVSGTCTGASEFGPGAGAGWCH